MVKRNCKHPARMNVMTTVILKQQQLDIQQLALVSEDPRLHWRPVPTFTRFHFLLLPWMVHITIDRRKLAELTQYILTYRPQVGELQSARGIDLTLSVGGTQKTLKESMRNNTQTETGMGNRSQGKHSVHQWPLIFFCLFVSFFRIQNVSYKVTFQLPLHLGQTDYLKLLEINRHPCYSSTIWVCVPFYNKCCGSFFTIANIYKIVMYLGLFFAEQSFGVAWPYKKMIGWQKN